MHQKAQCHIVEYRHRDCISYLFCTAVHNFWCTTIHRCTQGRHGRLELITMQTTCFVFTWGNRPRPRNPLIRGAVRKETPGRSALLPTVVPVIHQDSKRIFNNYFTSIPQGFITNFDPTSSFCPTRNMKYMLYFFSVVSKCQRFLDMKLLETNKMTEETLEAEE
jgi:hypothetical protein